MQRVCWLLALPAAASFATLVEAVKTTRLFEQQAVELVIPEPIQASSELVVRCVQS